MTLFEFIETFIQHNTLIRLWYENGANYECVEDVDELPYEVGMEHEVGKEGGRFTQYAYHKVIGVTDILIPKNDYIEAVNIVIERK